MWQENGVPYAYSTGQAESYVPTAWYHVCARTIGRCIDASSDTVLYITTRLFVKRHFPRWKVIVLLLNKP